MKLAACLIPAICLTAGALLFTMTKANAFADVPVNIVCAKETGFIMDPNQHKRVGYVTSLSLGSTQGGKMNADLHVFAPLANKALITYAPFSSVLQSPTAQTPVALAPVVGAISSLTWKGGVGDPINITMFVSQANATQLKAMQQATLTNTKVTSLGWWIADYDQEKKVWFEEFFPKAPALLSGQLAGSAGLNVKLTGAPVKDGIDVMVYQVDLSIAPAANQEATLQYANSPTAAKAAKSWGLVVGTLATTAPKK